jgi:di/tricarboxylate transporter
VTPEIAVVLAILAGAVVLLVSERLSADLVALLVMVTLILTRSVTATEGLAGFSHPAVVTVWAMFILSAALARTGVAGVVGRRLLAVAGTGEARLLVVLMVAAALLSSVMNNVGVVALLLPVVMDLARRVHRRPSRLLLPMTIATMLGGFSTLVSTPPNLLVSGVLTSQGLLPFGMFDFTPISLVATTVAILFIVLVSRRLLPEHDVGAQGAGGEGAASVFGLRETQFVLRVGPGSALAGHTLAESRLGSALGLNVVAISRAGHARLAPLPDTVLRTDDRLLVEGDPWRFEQVRTHRHFRRADRAGVIERLVGRDAALAELEVTPGSILVDQTVRQLGFRQRFSVQVLALLHHGQRLSADYEEIALAPGDVLLVIGHPDRIAGIGNMGGVATPRATTVDALVERYDLREQLSTLRVLGDSPLVGRSLVDSHLGDAFGIGVVAVLRGPGVTVLPEVETILQAGDVLFVRIDPVVFRTIRSLRWLILEPEVPPEFDELESEDVGLSEVVLSPHGHLAGRTLRDIHFREKYGLNVVAIWRRGTPVRSDLRDIPLRFGDALLVHGPRERLRVLAGEPDFLILTQAVQAPPRRERAPVAVGIMLFVVLLPAIMGWLPIAVSAVLGATLMVVSGCLKMDEAYRHIEWRAVFLMSGMLALGTAMDHSGAAAYLAQMVAESLGHLGPRAVLAGVLAMTSLSAQVMPNSAVAVLMAPIGIGTAAALGVSPYTFAMAVVVGAATGFVTPVGHPANLMVMGPGGYRFGDYVRVGLPVVLVVLAATWLALPVLWPLG